MNGPVLSICIPTYNRAIYLDELLGSIVSQLSELKDCIEICVSDNASTDHTDAIVKKYRDSCALVYHKNPKNLGPDANFLQCVKIAKGDYAWIVGSDDKLVSGAVHEIIAVLRDSQFTIDMLLFDFYVWYSGRSCSAIYPSFTISRHSFMFDANNVKEFVNFCEIVRTIATLFGFLSSIIFKRDKWIAQLKGVDEFIGSSFVQVYPLIQMVKHVSPCMLMYYNRPLVLYRAYNDSYLDRKDMLKRYLIDIAAYTRLSALFPDTERQLAVLKVLYNGFQSRHFLGLDYISWAYRSFSSTKETMQRAISILSMHPGLNKQYKILCRLQKIYNIVILRHIIRYVLSGLYRMHDAFQVWRYR